MSRRRAQLVLLDTRASTLDERFHRPVAQVRSAPNALDLLLAVDQQQFVHQATREYQLRLRQALA